MRIRTDAVLCLAALLLAACLPPSRTATTTGYDDSLTASTAVTLAEPAKPSSIPPLFCKVSKGAARFADGWRDFRPASFKLPPAMRVNVSLHPLQEDGEVSFQAYLDEGGQKMLFCPVIDGPPGKKISCASIYALDDDLDAGIKRTFDIPDAVEGGFLSCARNASKIKS